MEAPTTSRPSLFETVAILLACSAALFGLAKLDNSAARSEADRARKVFDERAAQKAADEREAAAATQRARAEARTEGSGRAPIFIPHGGALGISPAVAITEDAATPVTSSATALRRTEGPGRPILSSPDSADREASPGETRRTSESRADERPSVSDGPADQVVASLPKPAAAAPAAPPAAAVPAPEPSPATPWFVLLAGIGVIFCGAGAFVSSRG